MNLGKCVVLRLQALNIEDTEHTYRSLCFNAVIPETAGREFAS